MFAGVAGLLMFGVAGLLVFESVILSVKSGRS
jgi:hypothetical protein